MLRSTSGFIECLGNDDNNNNNDNNSHSNTNTTNDNDRNHDYTYNNNIITLSPHEYAHLTHARVRIRAPSSPSGRLPPGGHKDSEYMFGFLGICSVYLSSCSKVVCLKAMVFSVCFEFSRISKVCFVC